MSPGVRDILVLQTEKDKQSHAEGEPGARMHEKQRERERDNTHCEILNKFVDKPTTVGKKDGDGNSLYF
jgi:hypothetical protein